MSSVLGFWRSRLRDKCNGEQENDDNNVNDFGFSVRCSQFVFIDMVDYFFFNGIIKVVDFFRKRQPTTCCFDVFSFNFYLNRLVFATYMWPVTFLKRVYSHTQRKGAKCIHSQQFTQKIIHSLVINIKTHQKSVFSQFIIDCIGNAVCSLSCFDFVVWLLEQRRRKMTNKQNPEKQTKWDNRKQTFFPHVAAVVHP